MTLSKRIALPILVALIALLIYIYLYDHPDATIWIIAPVLALVVIFMLHPDLDRWWRKRNPPSLPPGMIKFIGQSLPSYSRLSSSQKKIVHQQTDLFLHEVEFMPQGFRDVPEEFKVAICGHMALIGAIDPRCLPLLHEFQKIGLYRHPFPSPKFPKTLHSSEIHMPDRMVLFSTTHAIQGYRLPMEYPNLVLYEFSKVLFLDKDLWLGLSLSDLETISGFPTDRLLAHIGLPEEFIDKRALALTYGLTFRDAFQRLEPEAFKVLEPFLNFNFSDSALRKSEH